MNRLECVQVRDQLADLAAGRSAAAEAPALRAHVEGCDACRSELRLLESLQQSPPVAPEPWLRGRILAAWQAGPARAPRRAWRRPVWAAGVATAALAGLLVLRPGTDAGEQPAEVVDIALETGAVAAVWPGGDGTVAGALVLEQLTDEELRTLLAELES